MSLGTVNKAWHHSFIIIYIVIVHVYERIWPVSPNGTVLQRDYLDCPTTVHICSGSAGSNEVIMQPWYDPIPEWSAFRYEEIMNPIFNGVSQLQVVNATHAYFRFINAQLRTTIDEIWISKVRRWLL